MKKVKVKLVPLTAEDREQFITDNQEAFNYGALEEFGFRDGHFEEDGQIISRKVIEASIDAKGAETYRNELDLLFVSPKAHSKGIGYAAWLAAEALHPDPNDPDRPLSEDEGGMAEGMFRFEKRMK